MISFSFAAFFICYPFCCSAKCWRLNKWSGGGNFSHVVIHILKCCHSLECIDPFIEGKQVCVFVFVGQFRMNIKSGSVGVGASGIDKADNAGHYEI